MTRQFSAALAFAAAVSLFGLASAASADAVVSASQQRDNKADHDKWTKTAPTAKKATATSSDEDADQSSEAKTAQAKLSPRHRSELNGHLHLGDW